MPCFGGSLRLMLIHTSAIVSAGKEPLRILIRIVHTVFNTELINIYLSKSVTVAEELLTHGILLQELLELLGNRASAVDCYIGVSLLIFVLCRDMSASVITLGTITLLRTCAAICFVAGTIALAEEGTNVTVCKYKLIVSFNKQLVILCARGNSQHLVTGILY